MLYYYYSTPCRPVFLSPLMQYFSCTSLTYPPFMTLSPPPPPLSLSLFLSFSLPPSLPPSLYDSITVEDVVRLCVQTVWTRCPSSGCATWTPSWSARSASQSAGQRTNSFRITSRLSLQVHCAFTHTGAATRLSFFKSCSVTPGCVISLCVKITTLAM